MTLKTIPFTASEDKKQYLISTFIEADISINILNEKAKFHKIPSGNFYKFGVIHNGKYFWYFEGVSVANDRKKMRELYFGIISTIKLSSDIPFIFKVKRL